MSKVLLIIVLATGCTTVKTKHVFVDKHTYMTWGMTNLQPIGVRELPSEAEICNNPMWVASCKRN